MSCVAAKQSAFLSVSDLSICEDAAILSIVLVPLNTSSTKQRVGISSLILSKILLIDLISTI